MSKITITAPGKTILHGEHAVVYGKAAIAVSLGIKTTVIANLKLEDKIILVCDVLNINKEFKLPDLIKLEFETANDVILANENYVKNCLDLIGSIEESGFTQAGITVFAFLYCAITQKYGHGKSHGIEIEIVSELPVGAGLGSSAALCVCIATSLLCLYQKIDTTVPLNSAPLTLELINKWAFQAERILHGSPSGIDNSICTYGGALMFSNGVIQEKLPKIPEVEILLVYSKVSRNAKDLVGRVKEKILKYPDVINPILDAIGVISAIQWKNLTEASQEGFSNERLQKFYDLVPLNQHLLNSLGVGHPKLDEIVSAANRNGFAAKLTGAGGGGCAIVFIKGESENDKKVDELKLNLATLGFDYWPAKLAGTGVELQL